VIVDAHQHFWNLDEVDYPWLNAGYGPLYRNYEPVELEPQLKRAGVAATVLVQAADSYADTESMLAQADRYDWIAGVVGWVPLTCPEEAAEALDRFCRNPKFVGIRHLIHEEQDPDWLLQPEVQEGLAILAERGVTFDVVSVLPRHLEHVPVLAQRHPNLKMVIDHLSKPSIKEKGWSPWADLLSDAASHSNVYAKVSGLNTAADWERWTGDDLVPYIDHAIDVFGAERLMFGSDWPVAILAGDYQKVRDETEKALSGRDAETRRAIWSDTAIRFYGLRVA
jgi:L-fuconolactonase